MHIPEHAKLFDSFICDFCEESTMISRKQKVNNKELCPSCTGKIFQSDGNGIRKIDMHFIDNNQEDRLKNEK